MRLQKDLEWLGALDPNLRVFDIIMRTEYGTTYNAYFLKGSDKTALFETVKAGFADQYFDALAGLTDIAAIDYLIVNHTEPDHSGSVERLLSINPNLTIVGTMGAIGFLKQIVNREFNAKVVRDRDTLSLGDKTLTFFALPNLHWPDTMFTYVEEMRTLFTCDAFGAHYAHPGILRSAVTDEAAYLACAKYYFDNILGPFKHPFVVNALNRVEGLPLDMICTGHGPVLDCGIKEIFALYRQWCAKPDKPIKLVVIPYVSAYGYTRQLAEAIARGAESGGATVRLHDLVGADMDAVQTDLLNADGILLGSPTVVGDALPPIWALMNDMHAVTHGGKRAGAFGSYGWSGEAVPNLIERLKQLKFNVADEGYRVRFKPTEADIAEAVAYGETFAQML